MLRSWRNTLTFLRSRASFSHSVVVSPGLTEAQTAQLGRGRIWRAYEMKEQFRAILAGDLTRDETAVLIDRWCARGPNAVAWLRL